MCCSGKAAASESAIASLLPGPEGKRLAILGGWGRGPVAWDPCLKGGAGSGRRERPLGGASPGWQLLTGMVRQGSTCVCTWRPGLHMQGPLGS